MSILVTGATGFLGRNVIDALRAQGAAVIAGVRGPEREVGGSPSVDIDLTSAATLDRALGDVRPSAIVHCAAYGVDHGEQDPVTAYETNVIGTVLLYWAARRSGIRRFIHIGTAYEYGHSPMPIDERHPLCPADTYGKTKAAASTLLLALRELAPPGAIILRPFGLFGAWEGRHKLVPQIIDAVRRRARLDLTAGTEIRDYLPVTDLARAIAALTALPDDEAPYGGVFNVCSGRATSVREFAEAVAAAAGGGADLRFGAIPSRPGAPHQVVGNPARWQALWDSVGAPRIARVTPLEEAVKAAMDADT